MSNDYEEIKITFNDGTSTLEWVGVDDDIQDVIVEIADKCNVSTYDVRGWKYTGKKAKAGE